MLSISHYSKYTIVTLNKETLFLTLKFTYRKRVQNTKKFKEKIIRGNVRRRSSPLANLQITSLSYQQNSILFKIRLFPYAERKYISLNQSSRSLHPVPRWSREQPRGHATQQRESGRGSAQIEIGATKRNSKASGIRRWSSEDRKFFAGFDRRMTS